MFRALGWQDGSISGLLAGARGWRGLFGRSKGPRMARETGFERRMAPSCEASWSSTRA